MVVKSGIKIKDRPEIYSSQGHNNCLGGGSFYLKVNCMDEVETAFIILTCHIPVFGDQHFEKEMHRIITKKTYHTAGCLENAAHGTLSICALSELLASTILMLPSANCSRSGTTI